ncbi:MAG: hypothetical protein IKN74_05760 [Clostridia bacterium]|nr:hypothetical protein [Clostridia bacterium]
MLNNIRITSNEEEITVNVSVIAEIHEIIGELENKMKELENLVIKTNFPIRVTGKLFTENEIAAIKELINKHMDVELRFDDISDLLGLHSIKKTFEVNTEITETKFIQASIRSGQRQEYAGSIVICGDVNPGAEVIAGGNIMVIGNLRGLAHAGANGNIKAIISANCIEDTQVRISNLVKEVGEKIEKCPVCEVLDNNIIISNRKTQ